MHHAERRAYGLPAICLAERGVNCIVAESTLVNELIEAGVHFGHRASRWNPKMKPYIYGKRNMIHIIDLKETVRGLLRATKYFHRVAASNGLILFVGTKRQAAETIVEECTRCQMPFVTERWLGGTLTNFLFNYPLLEDGAQRNAPLIREVEQERGLPEPR